jgi:hypothetical protein
MLHPQKCNAEDQLRGVQSANSEIYKLLADVSDILEAYYFYKELDIHMYYKNSIW